VSRRVLSLLLLVVLAALTTAALPGAASAAENFVDKQVQMNILLLQGYVNTQAEKDGFVYPAVADVRKGGALEAPVWPGNPWTGGTMVPGTSKGTYTYRVKADLSSYTLVGHLSKGSYKVTGGVPAWLNDERDASAKTGLALIGQYVDRWAAAHGGTPPPTGPRTARSGRGRRGGRRGRRPPARRARLAAEPLDPRRHGGGHGRRRLRLRAQRRRRQVHAARASGHRQGLGAARGRALTPDGA